MVQSGAHKFAAEAIKLIKTEQKLGLSRKYKVIYDVRHYDSYTLYRLQLILFTPNCARQEKIHCNRSYITQVAHIFFIKFLIYYIQQNKRYPVDRKTFKKRIKILNIHDTITRPMLSLYST